MSDDSGELWNQVNADLYEANFMRAKDPEAPVDWDRISAIIRDAARDKVKLMIAGISREEFDAIMERLTDERAEELLAAALAYVIFGEE